MVHLLKKRGEGYIKIESISEAEDIPLNYLRKIFQVLITNRVVSSGVGPKGGVRLPEKMDDISIADIIRLFDGEPENDDCTLFGTEGCPGITNCPLKTECGQLNKNIWKKLQAFKLEDLRTEEK